MDRISDVSEMYSIEELLPIVKELAEKYTSKESSSITYEAANHLMSAVLYCIAYAGYEEDFTIVEGGKLTARQAYENGFLKLKRLAEKAHQLYNEIMQDFDAYENRCLYDTMVKGLPEFFMRYDIKFKPDDYILTLDYPVLKDLSIYDGVERIYHYLECIKAEQNYLHGFLRDYVINLLTSYHKRYRDNFDNLCEIVIAHEKNCRNN